MSLADLVRDAQLPPPALRRSIRTTAGVSLRDVAGELGVTAMAVMRWERGQAVPRRDRAIAYRRLLRDLQEATE